MMTANAQKNRSGTPRRRFLSWLWAVMGIAAAGELVWAVFSFMRPQPPKRTADAAGRLIHVGAADNFPPGTVTAFPRGRFYLSRLADGGFLALSRKCTHLGCTVPWNEDEQQFVCPCHSSAFDIRGAVVRSPASRALDLYPVTIQNGRVTVDTGRTIRRSGFLPDQVLHP